VLKLLKLLSLKTRSGCAGARQLANPCHDRFSGKSGRRAVSSGSPGRRSHLPRCGRRWAEGQLLRPGHWRYCRRHVLRQAQLCRQLLRADTRRRPGGCRCGCGRRRRWRGTWRAVHCRRRVPAADAASAGHAGGQGRAEAACNGGIVVPSVREHPIPGAHTSTPCGPQAITASSGHHSNNCNGFRVTQPAGGLRAASPAAHGSGDSRSGGTARAAG
jgi:hypothetical protein